LSDFDSYFVFWVIVSMRSTKARIELIVKRAQAISTCTAQKCR